jgi:hypothetical protein
MIILPHRVKSIKKHFFEFSFDEDDEEIEPDFTEFKKLSTTEQYYLASIYNWDDGPKVLQWIIDSEKCDKGTATRIFWMAEPDYFFDFNSETIDKYEKDVFDLLQSIILRFQNGGFKSAKFRFIPKDEGYKTEWENAKGIWGIPEDLKNGNKGSVPIAIG